ncbi:MAG: acyl-CoA thioesterase [Desulfovibrionaceae bacterium]
MDSHSPYSIWFPHRVSYGETDTMGVVYYAEYLHFFERARNEYLRQIVNISYVEIEKMGYFLPVKEAYCEYKAPVQFDNLIYIYTVIDIVKNVSLQFSYKIYNENKTTLYTTGKTIHACINSNGKLKKLPKILHTIKLE